MEAPLECETVGPAAHFGHLIGRQRPRRLRHPRLFTKAGRLVGRVGQLHLRRVAQRPHAGGHRLAEILDRALFGHVSIPLWCAPLPTALTGLRCQTPKMSGAAPLLWPTA